MYDSLFGSSSSSSTVNTSRSPECSYPSCSKTFNLNLCTSCVDKYFCDTHSSHTEFPDHRYLPILSFNDDEIQLYHEYLKHPMTLSALPMKRHKSTIFDLEIEIKNGSGEVISSCLLNVGNQDYWWKLTMPPSMRTTKSERMIKSLHLECFWISLAFHLSKWPYVLRFEALNRLIKALPKIEELYVNPELALSADYFEDICVLDLVRNEPEETKIVKLDVVIESFLGGFNWVYGSKLGYEGELTVMDTVALNFLDIPELNDLNVIIILIDVPFKQGQTTKVNFDRIQLLQTFNSELRTICILQSFFPHKWWHFTPLTMSSGMMDTFEGFLDTNIDKIIPFKRRAFASTLARPLANDFSIMEPFDADFHCPNFSEALAKSLAFEEPTSLNERLRKLSKTAEAEVDQTATTTATAGTSASSADVASQATAAAAAAASRPAETEVERTATVTAGTSASFTGSLLGAFESEVEVFDNSKNFYFMYFLLNLLGIVVIKEAKAISYCF
jgi:hypothetical protein